MERISKEAATVLHALYSQYLSRRRVGQSKRDARGFGSVITIHSELCQNLHPDDVDEAMRELDRNNYLVNDYGDDTIGQCVLTDKAIYDCENLICDKIGSVADKFLDLAQFLASLRPQ